MAQVSIERTVTARPALVVTDLGAAHEAVRNWVANHGRHLAGPRWEVRGPHRGNPAEWWVDVSYRLA